MSASLRRAMALAGIVVVAGCGGGAVPVRGPFAAVWVAADSAPFGRSEATRLVGAGAGEIFLDAARLAWDGERLLLEPLPLRQLPRPVPTTLVVTGTWMDSPEPPRRLADSWSTALEPLSRAARAVDAIPVGVHFDLGLAGDPAGLTETLRRLRRKQRGRLFVSAALPSDGLDAQRARDLAAAVDFVVADVYGQPPEESDDAGRWDLVRTRERLAALDRLEVPYLAAAWTLGRADLVRRAGAVEPIAGALPLARLLRSPQFTVQPGSVFAGVDRQVLALEARQRTVLGSLGLERGDAVRVARPTTSDIEEFLTATAPSAGSRRLGVVLRRLPPPEDAVSAGASSFAAAFEPGEATPSLTVELVVRGEGRGRTRVAVRLANGNAEPTDLGGGEWNYVDLTFAAGSLGAVDPGDFVGWEQLWQGRERRTLRALRRADTLRLFAPYVGANETLESGTIELRGHGGGRPAVSTSGRFLLPGGRELLLPSRLVRWLDDEAGRTK